MAEARTGAETRAGTRATAAVATTKYVFLHPKPVALAKKAQTQSPKPDPSGIESSANYRVAVAAVVAVVIVVIVFSIFAAAGTLAAWAFTVLGALIATLFRG